MLRRSDAGVYALFGDIERFDRTIGDDYERRLFLGEVKEEDHPMETSDESAAVQGSIIRIRTYLAAATAQRQAERSMNVDDDEDTWSEALDTCRRERARIDRFSAETFD